MQKIKTVTLGGLVGTLYLEKLGYTWKIKTRQNGRVVVVGSSCVYLLSKETATEQLKNTMEALNTQKALFDINEYERKF